MADGFDVIMGVNTFSYYSNKLGALNNYRDILADTGHLLMLDVNGMAFSQQIAYLINLREARRFAEKINESTPKNLTSMLERAGFEVETMKRFTFMPNAIGKTGVVLWAPFDTILAHIPFMDTFAIRILWEAKKAR